MIILILGEILSIYGYSFLSYTKTKQNRFHQKFDFRKNSNLTIIGILFFQNMLKNTWNF